MTNYSCVDSTEKIQFTYYVYFLTQNPHPEKIEEKINSGQIEELIVQAENELNLARRVVKWKVWEPLQTHPPENQWRWPPNAWKFSIQDCGNGFEF